MCVSCQLRQPAPAVHRSLHDVATCSILHMHWRPWNRGSTWAGMLLIALPQLPDGLCIFFAQCTPCSPLSPCVLPGLTTSISALQAKRKRQHMGDLKLVVAGCVAQQEGAQLLRRVPELDLVLGPQHANR